VSGNARFYQSWQLLLLLLILGGIIGGWIGDAMVKMWPAMGILGRTQSFGIPNFVINLRVFTLNFGFMLHMNFFSIVGFILAYLVYRRL